MDHPPSQNAPDVPLIEEMENLGINEQRLTDTSKPSTSNAFEDRRVLRKKIRPIPKQNRRVMTRPKKYDVSKLSEKDIRNLYLCKNLKRSSPNLETIYEEPVIGKDNKSLLIGAKKLKRFIVFNDKAIGKGKIRKRKNKLKKAGLSMVKKRATMESLLERLKYVE